MCLTFKVQCTIFTLRHVFWEIQISDFEIHVSLLCVSVFWQSHHVVYTAIKLFVRGDKIKQTFESVTLIHCSVLRTRGGGRAGEDTASGHHRSGRATHAEKTGNALNRKLRRHTPVCAEPCIADWAAAGRLVRLLHSNSSRKKQITSKIKAAVATRFPKFYFTLG